jgi:hypothetical protein
MTLYIKIALLVVGGLVGWCAFFYTIAHLFSSRKREIVLIQEIRLDLERIKNDIANIKINR